MVRPPFFPPPSRVPFTSPQPYRFFSPPWGHPFSSPDLSHDGSVPLSQSVLVNDSRKFCAPPPPPIGHLLILPLSLEETSFSFPLTCPRPPPPNVAGSTSNFLFTPRGPVVFFFPCRARFAHRYRTFFFLSLLAFFLHFLLFRLSGDAAVFFLPSDLRGPLVPRTYKFPHFALQSFSIVIKQASFFFFLNS